MTRPGPGLSRRTLLTAGAVGAVGVAAMTHAQAGGIVLGANVFGLGGDPDSPVPAAGATTRWTTVWSAARGRLVRVGVSLPPGIDSVDGLPVCLVLHGRGGTAATGLERLGLGQFAAEQFASGAPPFAVVALDGGLTYWHRRADGDDPVAMVLSEVLPRLEQQGAIVDRLGVWGWSMGGFGALLMALEHPERIRAVVATSSSLWPRLQDATPGSFDDEHDWRAHGVLDRLSGWPCVPVRLDCGDSDEYAAVNRRARALLHAASADPSGAQVRGGHTYGLWRSLAGDQARWLAERLLR